jgi:hypothetical protein
MISPRTSHAWLLRMRITIGISLTLGALSARADQRSFVRAYDYATQPKGNLEFELWNEIEPPPGDLSAAVVTTRVELEYGLTDHWDLALYHVFEQGGPDHAPLRLDSWRVETRYRLAERGEWPVNVMLYLEGERPTALSDPFELEEKLILTRDLGRFGLVLNLVGEQKIFRGAERNWEVDLGARYELVPQLRVAAEVWTIQAVTSGQTKGSWYAGPSVSVASGRVWLQAGAGVGLGDATSQFQFRSVLGFNL